MKTLYPFITIFVSLIALIFLPACESTSEPETEVLSSFNISVPDTVTAGEPFTLAVTAVGSKGTRPFVAFNGIVGLSASMGTLSPDTLMLHGGAGSGEVIFGTTGGVQTITVTGGGKSGSVVLNADFMSVLPGDPGDPASEAIPQFEFIAGPDDYSDDHPELDGMFLSFNTIMINFESGTTVGEVNSILGGLNARIAGGITGIEGTSPGVLFLKLHTADHNEMGNVLAALEADPKVRTVVQDVLMGVNSIPGPNDGDPPGWTWEPVPSGGNWGLELIRVPQAWNFNEAVKKEMEQQQRPPSTVLIVDEGFVGHHPDVYIHKINPWVEDAHGTHVAGTIGAGFDNGKGVDGINPFVFMIGKSVSIQGAGGSIAGRTSAGQAIISDLYLILSALPYIDVVNMSIGYNWADAGIDSDTDIQAQKIVVQQAQLLVDVLNLSNASYRTPVIVASAGNESGRGFGDQDASFNSPMCFAALEMGIGNIIVVEAVEETGTGSAARWPFSSAGGHVSAPGSDIWSTVTGAALYGQRDGTSHAAAHVSGLAAYMLALEPYLTYLDVRELLLANTFSAGGGGSPVIDAWASVVDIDRVRSGDDVLRMMCDIDDGTVDGNQRIDNRDGSVDEDEDADGDGGIGDGEVDMSDFRRWRDWLLQIQDSPEHYLDGEDTHPKKDINANGEVESPAGENVFPRGDFNGDGILDEEAVAFVPGAIGSEVTDLEVLQAVFDDPDYRADELPELIQSGDVEFYLEDILSFFGAYSARAQVFTDDYVLEQEITLTMGDSCKVMTASYIDEGRPLAVAVSTPGGDVWFEFGGQHFDFNPGHNLLIRPVLHMSIDPRATYLHVCADDDDSGSDPSRVPIAAEALVLADYGIKPGDLLFINHVGGYYAGGGYTRALMGAVFSSSATLLSPMSAHRVPGAIDAGYDIVSEPTWRCGGEPTDIGEDIGIDPYHAVWVPDGATHLFVSALDSQYHDNVDSDGDYGVQITIAWRYRH